MSLPSCIRNCAPQCEGHVTRNKSMENSSQPTRYRGEEFFLTAECALRYTTHYRLPIIDVNSSFLERKNSKVEERLFSEFASCPRCAFAIRAGACAPRVIKGVPCRAIDCKTLHWVLTMVTHPHSCNFFPVDTVWNGDVSRAIVIEVISDDNL
jgi:hypothetical protein